MYIAVAAEGDCLQSLVSEEFVTCKYLLIINVDTMDIQAIENTGDPKGEGLARKTVEHNCEAVITKRLSPEAFDIIANDDITRYDGYGLSVKDALILMDQNRLKLIRNVQGTDECETNHTSNSCNDHHD